MALEETLKLSSLLGISRIHLKNRYRSGFHRSADKLAILVGGITKSNLSPITPNPQSICVLEINCLILYCRIVYA